MLAGKTALITGSTSGIGLGIAKALAKQHANIILNGRKENEVSAALVQELDDWGEGRIQYEAADLSDIESLEAMMARIGEVDILVNNAGLQHVSPIEDFPPERWDMVIALNLSAAFHTMRLALPHMKAQNWGRIINVASAHGHVASLNKSAYVASKHGLIGMTKVVALETAEHDITANSLCPGWVRTPLVEAQIEARAEQSGRTFDEEAGILLSEKHPSKQFVTPDQLGEACVFLCADAASQMTGATMNFDGGWTAQ